MKHTFKGDQEKVYKDIFKFLENDKGFLLLEGKAGTGKTKLVSFLVQDMLEQNYTDIAMIAPTGQAVKVLKDSADYDTSDITFSTIHSLFKLRPKKDREELYFIKNAGACPADDIKIFFVDEVSQLEDNLFYYLLDEAKAGKKVILVGDGSQTPPVNYHYSIPFTEDGILDYDIQVAKLKKPIRQKEGNPILDLGAFINTRIKRPILLNDREDNLNSLGEGIEYLNYVNDNDYDKIYDLIDEHIICDTYKRDHHNFKILAWTNKEVDFWNKQVRSILYGNYVAKLVIGEVVLAKSPVIERNGDQDEIIFSTNTELIIEDFEIKDYDIEERRLKFYETVVSFIDGTGEKKHHTINIIHETSQKVYDKILKNLAEYAKACKGDGISSVAAWSNFWMFKEMFAEVSYNYAITVHKAQGSTYKTVVVFESDIMKNRKVSERNRLMYTAITRASNNIFVVY